MGGHKSTQFSNGELRNVYISAAEDNGRIGWHDFPGLKLVSSGTGADRGHHDFGGVRYLINGTTLYKETSSGTRTSVGTIPGSDRAIFADNGTTLAIVANNVLYYTTGASVSTSSQTVVTSPQWVFVSNTAFVIGNSSIFAVSDPSDITSFNALNFASPEAVGDALIRGYWFNDLSYFFGTKSIETWFYSGNGNPPLDKRNNALINIGVAGKYAVCNSDQYLYWLTDDRKVYQAIGASGREIDTSTVSHILRGYSVVSDCIASDFKIDGQQFILFKFPTAGDTLIYSEQNNYWATLSAGTDKNARASWYGNAVQYCYDKNLVTDYRNGNTYELDLYTYTDNGDTRLRIITGPPITGAAIGKPQNQVTASSLMIPMQTGKGLATGHGSDPEIMCEWSPEGGEVWDTQEQISIGIMGDYKKKVMFYDFVTGYELVPRVMWSDPVPVSIYSGGVVELYDGGY